MSGERNAAWSLLHGSGASDPDKPAYILGESVLTYGELRERSLKFASFLDSRCVSPGDRVVLALPDTPAFVCAFLGTLLAGACPVPVNTFLNRDDYTFLLTDSGARLLLTSAGHPSAETTVPGCPVELCGYDGPPGLDGFPSDFAPRQARGGLPGFMLYSSGSTGRPKGVPHRQEDLLIPSCTWGTMLGLKRSDVVLSSSKLFFAYGLLSSLILPLGAGAATVLFPGKLSPYDAFDLMARHRPTAFFGVPTLYSMMVRAFEPAMRESVPGLCFSAGEALPAMLHEGWRKLTGVELLDGIGSTEACNVFISNARGNSRPGTAGRIVPGFEARIVDDAGEEVASGREGHLLVRGESFCRAYWNRPDKTRETMLEGGWVRTGDIFIEQDGWYAHQGRSDDMLKSAGQWVSPVLVEDALLRHAAVSECAVAARRVNGLDVICAFVVPAPGVVPDNALTLEWRRHLLRVLPEHMCPARFECVSELPKTDTGKVQRYKLRDG
ncbi:benzoate-CoA ligase family protein [Fundidesulfovibrio agrisoli]|uniref:benzoate-CoA ligase family protein n=1 Tax=Fundidesulfovibrio agrisoli TaxID=2922717 RepID=UPI001FAC1ED6|nr:benzoate-CoA ligase family protein [Fundidesulfovibrio agrisoli]